MSVFTAGSIIFCPSVTCEVGIIDGVTGLVDQITSKVNNPINAIYSMDNKGDYYVYGNNTAGYLHIYQEIGGVYTKIGNPASTPVAVVQHIELNDDATLCAVCMDSTPHFHIYDTSDWSKNADVASVPSSDVNGAGWGYANDLVAFASDTTPYLHVYDITDWSKNADVASLPTSGCRTVQFSPDDSLCVLGSTSTPYIHIYDTSDWSKEANPSTIPTNAVYDVTFSPDGTKLAVQYSATPWLVIYTVSDWSAVVATALNNYYEAYTAGGGGLRWLDGNTIVMGGRGVPGVVTYNATTGAIIKEYTTIYDTWAIGVIPAQPWEINGTINEALVATDWIATAYDYETHTKVGEVEFTGTGFTIPMPSSRPVSVTISAVQGSVWVASLAGVVIDDLVYPTDPNSTSYYYKATVAGTTGATEPTWPVTAGGTVVDGGVTWERVERLIQPITQSPLVPTAVT